MNIAKTISKFLKTGYASLTDDEKTLLKENVSLMSPSGQAEFQKQADAAAKDPEGDDAEGEDEGGEGEGDGADEGDDSVDEKALREMISKSVSDEIGTKVDSIAEQLIAKFFAGAKKQRKVALGGGDNKVNKSKENVTRKFMRALLRDDRTGLAEMQKATTFNSTDDSDARGGYLVPEELATEVLRIAEAQYGVARREFLYLPFTGPGNDRKIPTLATSVSVFWTDESAKKSATNPTFGLVTQTLKKLAAIVPFTEELMEDSAINLTQLIGTLIAEAMAKEEDLQFFMGTGSPWTGLMNNANVNKVELGAGDDFADVTADDLLAMIDATPAGALPGAKFYLHRQMLSVIRKIKDTPGQYIFQNPGMGLPATIWGYPYELLEAFPNNTTTGINKPLIAFGNLKLAAIFGDKQQLRVKLLDQATITDGDGTTVINLAEQNMLALRFEERVGYVLALPKAVTVLLTGDAS